VTKHRCLRYSHGAGRGVTRGSRPSAPLGMTTVATPSANETPHELMRSALCRSTHITATGRLYPCRRNGRRTRPRCTPDAAATRTDRPFSCGGSNVPHSLNPRAGNHPAPIPICRSRALCEYAEPARTRAQIIRARTSGGRVVGLSTGRCIWVARPLVVERVTTARHYAGTSGSRNTLGVAPEVRDAARRRRRE
jgi:hypothetical protein